MPEIVKQPHGGAINRFKKGEVGNPNGRPRKFVNQLKIEGYTLFEVEKSIQVLIALTIQELADVYNSPSATVLEKTIARAIKKSIEKGDLNSIETLLNRVFGRPKSEPVSAPDELDELSKDERDTRALGILDAARARRAAETGSNGRKGKKKVEAAARTTKARSK